jgi:RNA polymerase sigma factor (sigma-70 family)
MKDRPSGCVLNISQQRLPWMRAGTPFQKSNQRMSSQTPDTRYSLIMRLPDRQDVQAWDEFVSIYEPLIYRLARSKGLQHADAQEVVQEVLIAISKTVEHWQPDARLGRFRDWLFRISRNFVINYLTRRKYRGIGTGDSRIADLLAEQIVPDEESSHWFSMEERREVLQYCARLLQESCDGKQWRAFWLSTVQQLPVSEVAQTLQMSTGAVYIARSRMMNRLRLEVKRVLATQEEWSSLRLVALHAHQDEHESEDATKKGNCS